MYLLCVIGFILSQNVLEKDKNKYFIEFNYYLQQLNCNNILCDYGSQVKIIFKLINLINLIKGLVIYSIRNKR